MDFFFGPVPSRRLGRSLGINNIVPKTCTYSCVYCQLGKTLNFTSRRTFFYDPDEIFSSLSRRIDELKRNGIGIDYLTFVPDGEPTLDINLGKEIQLLKKLGIKIAVITNSSLIWDEDVQNALLMADWVSLKVDSIDEKIWRRINVPHRDLNFKRIISGIESFSDKFEGTLTTETMLVKNLNDSSVKETAEFIGSIEPDTAYISVPTRPPALEWVEIPEESRILSVYNIFSENVKNVETLTDFEGEDFIALDDVLKDILQIIYVHPMREDVIKKILAEKKIPGGKIDELVEKGMVREEFYLGKKYYIKKF